MYCILMAKNKIHPKKGERRQTRELNSRQDRQRMAI